MGYNLSTMTKKSRYLLIAFGFVVFFLFAPIIFLYVSGISYDFASGKFFQTGILSVITEPKTVNIFLGNTLLAKSSGNIKFLLPNEYNVKLQKEGFFDWTKRLEVKAKEVTWAAGKTDKIFLLKNPPALNALDSSVIDFAVGSGTLAYLSQKQFVFASLSNPEKNNKYPLPKIVNKIQLSPNGKIALLTGLPLELKTAPEILIFSSSSKKFTDISELFSNPDEIKFSSDNELYALENQILYMINLGQQTKTLLLNNVLTFTFQENNIYYIQKNGNSEDLMAAQMPLAESIALFKNLPANNRAEIVVSAKKAVFLLLDGTLYQVNHSLDKIAQTVSEWNFDSNQNSIIYGHSGEISYSGGSDNNFITRSGMALKNPALNLATGYAFVFKDKTLSAIELDTRDHQNEYPLYTANQPEKFWVDESAKNILVLDNGQLKNLQIR